MEISMEKFVAFLKNQGFVYQRVRPLRLAHARLFSAAQRVGGNQSAVARDYAV